MSYHNLLLSTVLLACAFCTASALGDTVFLTNGGRLEGKVTVKDGKVYIEQPDGVIVIDQERVARIEEKATLLDTYQERFAQIDAKAADAGEKYAALAQWCAEQRMKNQAALCYRKALSADPNNERARTALGYAKYNGAWMTFDEIQQARGMLRHKHAWISPEAKEELARLEAAQELELARAQVEQAKLELERLKLARAEAETARAQAELARLEAARRYPYGRYEVDFGYGAGSGYYAPVYYYQSRPCGAAKVTTGACGTGTTPSGSPSTCLPMGLGTGTGPFNTSTKINP